MGPPTKRDIEHKLEAHKRRQDPDEALSDVTVAWRGSAPADRPTGVAYEAATGTLTYDLWEAQQSCLDALEEVETDLVAFLAGYGSGKSIVGARWLLAQALTHPGSRFLAMGVDFTKARDSTFRILCEQLPGDRTAMRTGTYNGPESSPIVTDYNHSEHRLTLVNDTVIVLGSADRWSRHAGDEFGAIWLDEPSHYESDLHDLLEMLGGRLRGVAGPQVQCWTLTGNGYNDAWEILEQQQDKTGDPISLNIKLVRASTLENPYLDAGTIARYRRQYGDTAREEQALTGGFAAAQGLVYSGFSRETHVIPSAEADRQVGDLWRIYGYDYGWNDPCVVLALGQTIWNQLVVVDEYYQTESHIEDTIAWFETHEKPKGTIYCDHDPEHIHKFRRAGYSAKNATKNLDDGIAEVRKRLQDDGNILVRAPKQTSIPGPATQATRNDGTMVGLLVSDRCEHLIREFLGYKTGHVNTSGAHDHCLDALRYACMGVSGSQEPLLVPSTW